HRHRIQQFVGKMDAHEWLKRIAPFNLAAKRFQRLTLPLFQNGKRLDYSVSHCREKFRHTFFHELENVARELSVMRALFDNHEIVDVLELFPDFEELRGQ